MFQSLLLCNKPLLLSRIKPPPSYFAYNFVHQKFGEGSIVKCPLSLQVFEGSAGLDVPDGSLVRLTVDPEGLQEAQLG